MLFRSGMDGARQADGSMPNLRFLKLATGSDLINAGVNVGLPYVGTAPDIGAFEYTQFPLPTHISFPHARADGKYFDWVSSEEYNVSMYVVQESSDARIWKEIARTPAKGDGLYKIVIP